MDSITNDQVIAWLRRQLHARQVSLEEIADRASVPRRLLDRVFDPEARDLPNLTIRQTLTLADALGRDPVDLIREADMLSAQGRAFLAYCESCSESPLGDLWQHARALPDTDRTILVELVMHQRRRRWHAG